MSEDTQRYLELRGLADVASIRNATFDGAPHIVVPVVALVGNSVVRPMNSRGPEFVPAEELSVAPSGWDGRPVVPDHPEGGTASANTPANLEAMRFGNLFNTKFEDGKLKTEAWLDTAKARELGGDALRVVERVQDGEMVEVSVGAWVSAEAHTGEHNGEAFSSVWRDVVPDHLAMLPEGTQGACSVDMGCGAPRVNKRKAPALKCAEDEELNEDAEANMATNETEVNVNVTGLTWFKKALDMLKFKDLQDGMSDADLREGLFSALRADEPGFEGIQEVFPNDGVVIYVTAPEGELQYFEREFDVSEDGEVSLAEDKVQVEPTLKYEPVAAQEDMETKDSSEESTLAAGDCGCNKNRGDGGDAITDNQEGDATTMSDSNLDGLVERLIASEVSPFTEDDRSSLEAFGEDRLTELADGFTEASESADEEPVTAPEDNEQGEDTVQLSRQDYEDMRAAAGAFRRQEEQRRKSLISSLSVAQDTYSKEELAEKDTEELEKLTRLAKVDKAEPDYSGRGFPTAASRKAKKPSLPDPYGLNRKEAN